MAISYRGVPIHQMSDEEFLAAIEDYNTHWAGKHQVVGNKYETYGPGALVKGLRDEALRRGYKLQGNKPGDYYGIYIGGGPAGGNQAVGGDGTPAGSEVPEVIQTASGEVVSGMPTFNKALRELFSNIFSTALGHAAAQSGGGDVFSSFLPQFLSQFNIPTPIAGATPQAPDTPPVDAGTQINRNLPLPTGSPTPIEGGGVALPPGTGKGFFPEEGREIGLMPAGGMGVAMKARSSGYNPNPGAGGIPIAELASLAPVVGQYAGPVLDAVGGLLGLGGEEKQVYPQEVLGAGDPYEPIFNDPNQQNSLTQLMNFMQVFGPAGGMRGSGLMPLGATPDEEVATAAKGDRFQLPGDALPPMGMPTGITPFEGMGETLTADQVPLGAPTEGAVPVDAMQTETTDQFMPGQNPFADFFAQMGMGDFGGQQGNFMQNLAQFFSLPAFGGPFTTPAGPLQTGATNAAAEFLRGDPFTDTQNIQKTLNEMVTTGGRFDLSPEFSALEDINRRRLEEERANMAEQYGTLGGRFGSDIGRSNAELTSRFLEAEALQKAQLARDSFESAQGRRMGALPMGGQLSAQQLANLGQVYGMGEQNRQIGNEAINRAMAEYARTQGALLPLLLQFALAGSEGDFLLPNPTIV